MVTKNMLDLHQLHSGPSLPGCWSLRPGRVISLLPREAGMLRIAQGQVWATFDGPHQGHGNESGDHFLQAGQHLLVRAGQRLVFEPWRPVNEAPVYFEWTPVPTTVTVRASRWNATVMQPLQDLGLALLLAGSALARLAMGLAGYGEYLVAGRGRVMAKFEANQP